MNCQAGPPIDPATRRLRSRQRIAFATALLAVPLLGVLANAPLRSEALTYLGVWPGAASPAQPTTATAFPAGVSAAPDHALLDAADVRRALPPQQQSVAGLQNSTL